VGRPVHSAPLQPALRSVHRLRHLTCPSARLAAASALTGSPGSRQLPFGPGTCPVSGRLSRPTPWKGTSRWPGFPLPFGRRHSLLGHPFPPGIPPLLRSAYRQPEPADHDGVSTFRTREMRPDWAPSLPRDQWCSHGPSRSLARHLPSLTGTGPVPRLCRHLSGVTVNEASARVHAIRPPGLPLARRPRMTREPLRLSPWAPHPHEQDPRAHARAGTGSEH
jgi:hypothetical protein